MKVSKYFVFILVALIAIAFGVHFFVTKKIATLENPEVLSQLDTYLFENYSLSLHLDRKAEEAISVFCDTEDKDPSVSDVVTYGCQNKNPIHKIMIGSAGNSQSYVDSMTSVGNDQLFWKNAIDNSSETGKLSCKEWPDARGYNNITSGINCVTVTSDGSKLYSSIIFLEPKTHNNKKVFIAVVNTLQTSSLEKTEQEIISLLSNQKISRFGKFIKFISFLREDSIKFPSSLEISSGDSLESQRVDKSMSSNFVTLLSGDGIDGEVCDASKISSCHPVYCNSPTAVWGKSIFRCVEPAVPNKDAVEGVLCLGDLPIWDGSKCRALTGDIISNNICLIPLGSDSCQMNITWSIDSPQGNVEVRYLGPTTTVLANVTSGSIMYTFPYKEESHTVGLFEGDKKNNEGKFITKCKSGGFDTVSKKCVDPSVLTYSVIGEYYKDSGFLVFSCAASDGYSVKSTERETIIATGTYFQEMRVPVDVSGNYSVSCSKGNYTSSSLVRYYNAPPPPPPVIVLGLSPQSVSFTGTTTLSWNILYPKEECSLKAKSYCKASGCTDLQSESEDTLNRILASEEIEESTQANPMTIQNSLKKVVIDSSTNEMRALGTKKLTISQTTDFIINCGSDVEVKRRVYIGKKQKSQEQ